MRRFLSLLTIAMFAIIGVANSGCGGKKGSTRINGSGATFVDLIMQKWSSEYKEAKTVEVDYNPLGSGTGIQQMTEQVTDFGCSDAPMNKKELDSAKNKGGEVIHIPVITGAVGILYNLPDVTDLKLSGPIIADIYLGKIKKWNEKTIADLNPGVKLPELEIIPVYRADSSGTTFIFTEYLSKASSEFAQKVGANKAPKWPEAIKGTGQKGSDGIAGQVQRAPGSIGYAEISYAIKDKISYASVRNKKGKDIKPESAAVTAAAAAVANVKPTAEPYSLHELTYSFTDTEDEAAYPIVGASYAILYKKQRGDQGKALVEFLKWVTSDGQKFAKDLHYAPLPAELQKKVAERLGQVVFE